MYNKIYDVIIIGAGPAGLSAAIYTSREKISTLLLEKGICGGLPILTDIIENYPGFPDGIRGMDLMDKIKNQAQKFQTEIIEFREVKKIQSINGKIKVNTDEEEYASRALIIASGTIPKRLDAPGEKEFTGKGVSYCATCDGPLFKNKDIIVVGGGNAAVEEALFLSKFANKVSLVHRRDKLPAAKILQERLYKEKKIELLLNHNLLSIRGEKNVSSVIVQDNQTKKEKPISIQGVFIFIGYLPNTEFLKGVVELDEEGYIKADEKMQTSNPGIFAAGDVRSKGVRQVVTACAEGAIAAVSVRDYLKLKIFLTL